MTRYALHRSVAALALAGAVAVGVAACSDDDNNASDTTTTVATTAAPETTTAATSPAETSTADSSTPASGVPVDLTTEEAQKIVRTLFDPNTTAAEAGALVAVDDDQRAATGESLHQFAQIASKAGYTPDVATAKSVTGTDDDEATVVFAIKSPHAPAPVDVSFTFEKEDGKWLLTDKGAKELLGLAGPH